MVLRGTYGEKVHRAFRMTRQGVRWRFWRIYNDIYISAFTAILFIEQTFGTQFREYAIRISKERYALRQEAFRSEFQNASAVRDRTEDSDEPMAAEDKQSDRRDRKMQEPDAAEDGQPRKAQGDGQ